LKEITKICIIGGGVVETDGRSFYLKNQTAEYLEGLSGFFEEVYFVTRLQEGRSYISRINNKKVRISVLGKTRPNARVRDILYDACSHLKYFPKIADKSTGVILSHLSATALLEIILCKIYGGVVLYYVGSDPLLTEQLKEKNLRGLVKRKALRIFFPLTVFFCDGILVRGNTAAQQCRKWSRNVILSRPIISYQKIRDHLNETSLPRGTGYTDLLYVGKLEENKGIHILFEAFIRLREHNRQVQLTVVGDGVLKKQIMQRAKTAGCEDDLVVTGYVDDPANLMEFYMNADVLVVPSVLNEGFPRVIDEAMAFGIPVICSHLGGMASAFNNNEVLFVKPGDEEDLYNKIYFFLTDSTIRTQLHNSALSKAKNILSETAAEQHAKFIVEIHRSLRCATSRVDP
jgi:glycosyltransferase involved in cell wall biosynthesis